MKVARKRCGGENEPGYLGLVEEPRQLCDEVMHGGPEVNVLAVGLLTDGGAVE
jgi:hypothetical protein